MMQLIANFLVALMLFVVSRADQDASPFKFYICDAAEPKLLGEYVITEAKNDGVAMFTNSHGMSLFRNRKFWYIGNMGPWPPETYYRCVEQEGCNYDMDVPPTTAEGIWRAAKMGKEPAPKISTHPCEASSGPMDDL